jgi:predicted DNA-binding transcriptional regulator YafY
MAEVVDRYAPARRLHQLKSLLNSSGGVTVYDIAERLRISVKTATRYLKTLEAAGEPLYEEIVGRRKVWRLRASARHETITLTTSQMIALFLSGRVFDFLKGTGFKEDLDDVFARLEATLKRKDFVAARNLDRKIFDVNEAPHVYAERLEDVNDITTALIREERLRVRHDSVRGGRVEFIVEPYTHFRLR